MSVIDSRNNKFLKTVRDLCECVCVCFSIEKQEVSIEFSKYVFITYRQRVYNLPSVLLFVCLFIYLSKSAAIVTVSVVCCISPLRL